MKRGRKKFPMFLEAQEFRARENMSYHLSKLLTFLGEKVSG